MATATELAQAQAALHKLRTGSMVAEVKKSDGSKVKFSATNVQDLQAYVDQLKYELGQTTTPRRFAIKVGF